jgi:hypothetical protein
MSRAGDAVREIRSQRSSFVFGPYAEPMATVEPRDLLDTSTADGDTLSLEMERRFLPDRKDD